MANNIAFHVMQNKTEVDIYSAEKLRIQSQNKKKLTGYINSMDYEKYRATTHNTRIMRRLSSGVFSETSSVSFSQCSATSSVATSAMMAADENRDQVESSSTVAERQPSYNVLRENVDTEQRQQQQQQLRLSSQKGFSGKDQKNVSPYSGDSTKRKLLVGSATLTTSSALISKGGLNVTKAKRQISFDA